MKQFDGKRVLVTGAASGIGRATAEAFAREGATLLLCDVDEKGLAEVARETNAAVAERVDVSKRDEMNALADSVHAHGPLDVLVNNAGVGLAGGVLDTSLEDWEWILSINLWGVIHGVHYFVPEMVEAGRGNVVNVASALGLFAGPGLLGYSTTKFGVVGLSESMRAELEPRGVHVSCICPGVIDTNIVKTTRYKAESEASRDRVIAMYKKRNYGPEKVARSILDAVRHDRAVVPVSPEAWFAWYVKRYAPGLSGRISRLMARGAMGSRSGSKG